jgi:hypothetical protein
MPRILEGIITTVGEGGDANISPLGPWVAADMQRMTLRPYQSSNTYRNLKRTGHAVFHVTDDVLLLARAAVGQLEPLPELLTLPLERGFLLVDACRWYALELESLDDSQERAEIVCRVVDQGRNRDFFGFNRAKHAVLEAAILATRIEFLCGDEIAREMKRLAVVVEKTGGPEELEAFGFLKTYLGKRLSVSGERAK